MSLGTHRVTLTCSKSCDEVGSRKVEGSNLRVLELVNYEGGTKEALILEPVSVESSWRQERQRESMTGWRMRA